MMPTPTSLPRLCAILLLAFTAALATAAPKKVALLVGIGQYAKPGLPPLEGPTHDATAMQKVLVERWGYQAADVHMLLDQAATRQAIVAELGQLVQRTQPGDEVLLFMSGHGTSPLQDGMAAVPDGSGGFYAHDSSASGENLLIGRFDLRPVLEQLDQGSRKVWFVVDSCFAGNMARSVGAKLHSKLVPLLETPATTSKLGAVRARLAAQQDSKVWPYKNVAFLSASSAGEPAQDIPAMGLEAFPTVDGKPHAAMTDALLRVLSGALPADIDRNGSLSLQEVYETVVSFMATRNYGQYPQRRPAVRDDQSGLLQRALLSGPAVRAPLSQPVQPQKLQLRVEPKARELAPSLVNEVARLPGLSLAGPSAVGASFQLAVDTGRNELTLLTRDGDLFTKTPLAKPAAIVGALQQQVWLAKVEALLQSGRRGVLPAEICPAELGVTRMVGDQLDFTVRPDRDAYLVVLNVNSHGEVSVVYPGDRNQMAPLAAGEPRKLMGFRVEEPEGQDVQLWIAFDQQPAGLDRQVGRTNLPPGDARLIDLETMIAAAKGGYTLARTEFRTYLPGTFKRGGTPLACR